MSHAIRWTVRNIEQNTIDIIAEVHETSGITYGELLNEAVLSCYESLPEVNEEAYLEEFGEKRLLVNEKL
jgi:hypothetical protein